MMKKGDKTRQLSVWGLSYSSRGQLLIEQCAEAYLIYV